MNKFDTPYFNLHRNTSNWLKHLYPMLFGVTSFSISWLFFLLNLFGSVCMAPRKSNNPSCNLTCVIVFMHNAITTQSLSLSFSFLSLSFRFLCHRFLFCPTILKCLYLLQQYARNFLPKPWAQFMYQQFELLAAVTIAVVVVVALFPSCAHRGLFICVTFIEFPQLNQLSMDLPFQTCAHSHSLKLMCWHDHKFKA